MSEIKNKTRSQSTNPGRFIEEKSYNDQQFGMDKDSSYKYVLLNAARIQSEREK